MDERRLRARVTAVAVVATAATGVVVGLNPLPGTGAAVPASAPVAGDQRLVEAITARETQVVRRLRRAEQRAREATAASERTPAPGPAPVVQVAPTPVAPVTRSASS